MILSCTSNQKRLANTKWLTTKFTIDSLNYLNDIEKKVYSDFDPSIKLYLDLSDTLAITYVEGRSIDTSSYQVRDDTLFFIHKINYRDTSIIVKLSKDCLITQRLAGVKTYSVKQK